MKRKPTTHEWFAMGGTLLWTLAFFLPWYRVRIGGVTVNLGGHEAGGLRWLLFVVAVGLVVYLALVCFGLLEIGGPHPGAVATAAGAVLAVGTLVFAFLAHPAGFTFAYGVFLSLLGALAAIYGGFAMYNQDRAAGGMRAPGP